MAVNINEAIDCAAVKKLIDSFVLTTGLNAQFLSSDGGVFIQAGQAADSCALCKLIWDKKQGKSFCFESIQKAGRQSAQIGEPYIAVCHAGLIEIYSPVVYGSEYLGVVTCGPLFLWELDELAEKDILEKLGHFGIEKDEILKAAKAIPVFTSRSTQAAADLLFAMVNHIAKTGVISLMQRQEIYRQQMRLADLIIDRKRAQRDLAQIELRGGRDYPLGKEKELLGKVRLGDRQGARKILNEILGLIFYNTTGDMDIIKARVLELIVVISRAAVEGGAELERLLGLNFQYISKLYEITSFDDICIWLVEILDTFMDTVFDTRNVKNATLLGSALEIMREGYAGQLSLLGVASQIHISPYYLSHLFKDELGITFLDYLTKVRIEEAKKLLTGTRLTIKDVAEKTGYDDAGYFSKVFKKQVGVTPNDFRRRNGFL